MRTLKKHFIVDTLLIVLMLVTAVTGLLVWLVFPHDSGCEEIAIFLEEIHTWVSIALLTLTTYHLIVHWDWYKRAIRNFWK